MCIAEHCEINLEELISEEGILENCVLGLSFQIKVFHFCILEHNKMKFSGSHICPQVMFHISLMKSA